MAALEYKSTSHSGWQRWPDVFRALQWGVSAAATVILFFASLNFFNAIEPLSSFGEGLILTFGEFEHSVRQRLFEPLAPGLRHSASTFLMMIIALVLTMSGVARDRRVHLISFILVTSAAALLCIASTQVHPAILNLLDKFDARAPASWTIIALCAIAVCAVLVSFRSRPPPAQRSDKFERFKKVFTVMYWAIIITVCTVQFFTMIENTGASEDDASATVLTILVIALLFMLGLWIIASGLISLQIIIWSGSFEPMSDAAPHIGEFFRQSIMTNVSDPALHLTAGVLPAMLVVVWLSCSACALMGTLGTARLLRRYAFAIGGAFIIAMATTDFTDFSSAIYHFFALPSDI